MFEQIKTPDQIEDIINMIKSVDTVSYAYCGMNYSVRGRFLSIYLQADHMCHLINVLASKGYISEQVKHWATDRGYSATDAYFKIGPYDVRIALYREKLDNNSDIKWLQEKYLSEINYLKSELKAAISILQHTNKKYNNLLDEYIKLGSEGNE